MNLSFKGFPSPKSTFHFHGRNVNTSRSMATPLCRSLSFVHRTRCSETVRLGTSSRLLDEAIASPWIVCASRKAVVLHGHVLEVLLPWATRTNHTEQPRSSSERGGRNEPHRASPPRSARPCGGRGEGKHSPTGGRVGGEWEYPIRC